MSTMRTIGYKIFILAKEKNAEKKLMEKLNFSSNDLHKLYEGRLAFSDDELSVISEELKVPVEDILDYEETEAYPEMIHCMSSFTRQENCDKVLDIIDSYIDIKEAVLNS